MEQNVRNKLSDGILVAGCTLALIVFLYSAFIV